MAALTTLSPVDPSRRANHSSIAFMSPDEVRAVLKIARQRRTRDWCMILIAYRHGLRTEEVCGLKLGDVKDGVLSVQRLKGSLKTDQPLRHHHGDTPLDEIVALRTWLNERAYDGSDVLFRSRKGGALDRTQFFRIFQAIAKAAGLPASKRHPRILKYTLASHLLASNVGLTQVTQILGHRSILSTLRYARAIDQHMDEIAKETPARYFEHLGAAHLDRIAQNTW